MKKYRIVNQAMIDGKYINMVYLVEKRFLWFWVPIYDGSLSKRFMSKEEAIDAIRLQRKVDNIKKEYEEYE